jgi:small subunit ribosomal protein S20
MANHKSALKRIKQNVKRNELNLARKSRVKTFVKSVYDAISAGNKEAAASALRVAESELMSAVTKGVMHKNTASRKVSRLAAAVKTAG